MFLRLCRARCCLTLRATSPRAPSPPRGALSASAICLGVVAPAFCASRMMEGRWPREATYEMHVSAETIQLGSGALCKQGWGDFKMAHAALERAASYNHASISGRKGIK